jgi:hypothetical protein
VSVYSAAIVDNVVQAEFQADSAGRYYGPQTFVSAPPSRVGEDSRYVGFGFEVVVLTNGGNASLPGIAGTLFDDSLVSAPGFIHLVRGGGSGEAYPPTLPNVETIYSGNGTNIDSCTPVEEDIFIAMLSAAAGVVQFELRNPFWIARLDEPC